MKHPLSRLFRGLRAVALGAVLAGGFTWNLAGNPDDATHLPQSWRLEVRDLPEVQGLMRGNTNEWIAVGFRRGRGILWVGDDQGRPQKNWLTKQGRKLVRPSDLTGTARQVWISDAADHRIWRFDRTKKSHFSFGGYGTAPGLFNHPNGLWWDGDNLWVADLGNQRVQRFDRNGRVTGVFSQFSSDRTFIAPTAITGDGQGRFYVADAVLQQITVLDAAGKPLATLADYGFFPGLIDHPTDLLWDRGRLLVLEHRNHRIQAFTPEGGSLWLWGEHEVLPHEGRGRLHYPNHFAVDNHGNTLVIAESLENRLQFFDWQANAQPIPYDPQSIQSGRFHFGPYLDIQGTLLVTADTETHQVMVYDMRGETPININQFGERGNKFGLMRDTRGLVIDAAASQIITTDSANQRIQVFHYDHDPMDELKQLPDMTRFKRAFSYAALNRRAATERAWFDALAVDPDGAYRLIDPRHHRVLVFDRNWNHRQTIGSFGHKRHQFNHPTDLAFTRDGAMVVVDQNNRRLVKIDKTGRVIGVFGRKQLHQPFGIAVHDDGRIFVSDQARCQILVFSSRGRFLHAFGGRGSDMGQLWRPADIDFTADGRLCVVDQGNHRLQIFGEDGSWLVTMDIAMTWTHRFPPPNRKTTTEENQP
ncbi:NHL repeat-containing protein [Acanthopleuribacter pedis]|uniref:NHL repeat-containing protein n=1 Tax=Acanthopleuribacter pedis TaxID=442870 RepID=A0A8J7U2N5_9BACT|nr:NHL repeat-containing protein [Acanthopleuribacter pedis]MBO1317909.1 hypothetical protein [Acanthopleuribacter pedis]